VGELLRPAVSAAGRAPGHEPWGRLEPGELRRAQGSTRVVF